ncbi:MAG TPA: hypothetical protein VNV82_22835 [Bryobacteraceae bacterium]|nr:hypothetical protein [Bryobacteraceae bacterium]
MNSSHVAYISQAKETAKFIEAAATSLIKEVATLLVYSRTASSPNRVVL